MALTTNLVAYYKLDEASGNAADSSGNGNTLTNENSVAYGSSYGIINNGANFTGAANSGTSLIAVGNTNFNFTGNFSFSMWLRNTNGSAGAFVIAANGEATVSFEQWELFINGNNVSFYVYADTGGSTSQHVTSTTAFNTATWHHLVCVRDGTNLIMYVDGSSQATAAWSTAQFTPTVSNFALGGQYDIRYSPANSNGGAFNIDEVGVWSRALTSGEASQLYNGGAGLQYPFVTSVFTSSVMKNQAVNRSNTY